MTDVGVLFAVLAGIASFLSPCVLPLIPGYISFISGISVSHFEHATREEMQKILQASLLFVLGFTLVFVALGASASAVGAFLKQPAVFKVLETVAGLFIIFMGLFLLGVIKLPFMYEEHRMQMRSRKFGLWSALPLGMAFAFGWTPCIGPILSGILFYASTSETVTRGAFLLFAYSMGLGIPFVLTAMLVSKALKLSKSAGRITLIVYRVSGVLLIVMGLLLVTHQMAYVNVTLQKLLPSWLQLNF